MRRRTLNPAEHRLRSTLACSFVRRLAPFRAGRRVALYLSFDREVDTAALLHAAHRRGVHVLVPVIVDRRHGRIRFYPLRGRTRPGRFGIAVPQTTGLPLSPRWLHLIVVPLVGVDDEGRRLGMGGGFYDRALSFRRVRRAWMGPRCVGLAFECQRADTSFADPWDVRLDALATESGLHRFFERGPTS